MNKPLMPFGSELKGDKFLSPDVVIGTMIISASGIDFFTALAIISA